MPHSNETGHCPYCGKKLSTHSGPHMTCADCRDLLALEPLDDRYLLTEEE